MEGKQVWKRWLLSRIASPAGTAAGVRTAIRRALGSSELAGFAEAETSASCLVVIAALESPAIVAGLDDVAVMGQAVEQCGSYFCVAEHARPFAEG